MLHRSVIIQFGLFNFNEAIRYFVYNKNQNYKILDIV